MELMIRKQKRHGAAAMTAMAFLLGAALSPVPAIAEEGMAKDTAARPDAVTGTLNVRFEGLRSERGLLSVCLTRDRAHFPKCENDPAAFKGSVKAGAQARIALDAVPPGDYALLVLHDENGNGKLDTTLGIPREGVGFSRNPRIRFGPPRFDAVSIHVPAGASEAVLRLQYFL